jgi:hypothetical protein
MHNLTEKLGFKKTAFTVEKNGPKMRAILVGNF